jgi:hypothetical protein
MPFTFSNEKCADIYGFCDGSADFAVEEYLGLFLG